METKICQHGVDELAAGTLEVAHKGSHHEIRTVHFPNTEAELTQLASQLDADQAKDKIPLVTVDKHGRIAMPKPAASVGTVTREVERDKGSADPKYQENSVATFPTKHEMPFHVCTQLVVMFCTRTHLLLANWY